MTNTKRPLIHLALTYNFLVVAQFAVTSVAARFCEENNLYHIPFNLDNRDNEAAPLIGTVYRA
jgi:hypothetical protein